MISKELQNLDLIYHNVNLTTDVLKVIVKYRRKIIAKYRQIFAICRPVGTELKKKHKKKSSLLDESRFLDICTIMELKELN